MVNIFEAKGPSIVSKIRLDTSKGFLTNERKDEGYCTQAIPVISDTTLKTLSLSRITIIINSIIYKFFEKSNAPICTLTAARIILLSDLLLTYQTDNYDIQISHGNKDA